MYWENFAPSLWVTRKFGSIIHISLSWPYKDNPINVIVTIFTWAVNSTFRKVEKYLGKKVYFVPIGSQWDLNVKYFSI